MTTVTTEERTARTERMYARAEEIVKRLPGVSIGYIGNLTSQNDDRSWMIFLPHPGRVGTTADSLGCFSTADRYRLLGLAMTLETGYRLGQEAA